MRASDGPNRGSARAHIAVRPRITRDRFVHCREPAKRGERVRVQDRDPLGAALRDRKAPELDKDASAFQ